MTTYSAQGTTLGRGDAASPEVFTTIPQVITIGETGVERSLKDVTDLSSTIREFDSNLPEGTELSCEAWYDPVDAVHAGLKADLDNNVARNFELTLTDSPAEVHSFTARVIGWKVGEIEVDGHYRLLFNLKITTSYTIA